MVYDGVQNWPIFDQNGSILIQNDSKGMERHVQNTGIPKNRKKGQKKGPKKGPKSLYIAM